MKRKSIAGIVIVLVVIAIYLTYTHRTGPAPTPPPAGETTAGTSSAVNAPADQAEPIGKVDISPDRQQMVGIRTVTAGIGPMKKTVRTVGRVEFDERRVTTVNIKVEGWIENLYVDYTGKKVSKGTPLAEIYSPELLSLQLEYLNLLKWKPNLGLRTQRTIEFSLGDRLNQVGKITIYDLDSLVEVAKQKMSLWEISDDQIKELETSRKPMRTLTIKSPQSGYVFQKPVFKGTRVAPGDKIFDIVDLSSVWVLADIYEYELPFVKAGQKVKITLSHWPEKEFSGRVDFVYPTLSGQTRTAKARIVLPNPGAFLKPQMFANVEMELDLGQRLAIPETAVLDTGTRQVVFVDSGNGGFVARQVKTGYRAEGMVEILKGLQPGEKVASSAVFLIDSEAKLKGVTQ